MSRLLHAAKRLGRKTIHPCQVSPPWKARGTLSHERRRPTRGFEEGSREVAQGPRKPRKTPGRGDARRTPARSAQRLARNAKSACAKRAKARAKRGRTPARNAPTPREAQRVPVRSVPRPARNAEERLRETPQPQAKRKSARAKRAETGAKHEEHLREAPQGQREAQRMPGRSTPRPAQSAPRPARSVKNARAKRWPGNDNLSELSYDPSVAWKACAQIRASRARGLRKPCHCG
jgi:hypothetical protein